MGIVFDLTQSFLLSRVKVASDHSHTPSNASKVRWKQDWKSEIAQIIGGFTIMLPEKIGTSTSNTPARCWVWNGRVLGDRELFKHSVPYFLPVTYFEGDWWWGDSQIFDKGTLGINSWQLSYLLHISYQGARDCLYFKFAIEHLLGEDYSILKNGNVIL